MMSRTASLPVNPLIIKPPHPYQTHKAPPATAGAAADKRIESTRVLSIEERARQGVVRRFGQLQHAGMM